MPQRGELARGALGGELKSRSGRIPLFVSVAAGIALLPVCFPVDADPNAANLAPQASSFRRAPSSPASRSR